MQNWLDPQIISNIPGPIIGLLGAIIGLTAKISYGEKGRKKYNIFLISSMILSALFFLAGVIFYANNQPKDIWFGLGLPGLIGMIIFGMVFIVRKNINRNEKH